MFILYFWLSDNTAAPKYNKYFVVQDSKNWNVFGATGVCSFFSRFDQKCFSIFMGL